MSEQKPTVGRVVHYVSHGSPVQPDDTQRYSSECRAAIVTAVEPVDPPEAQFTSLCVLNPTGMFFNEDTQHDPGVQDGGPGLSGNLCDGRSHRGGTWHWPART